MNKPANIPAARFSLFLWPHRMLVLGPAFDSQWHSHHAAQIAIGLEGTLRLGSRDREGWQQARAFFIPPDAPHEFDAHNSPCALLYLYPEGRECEQLCQRYGKVAVRQLGEQHIPFADLHNLALGNRSESEAEMLCAVLVGEPLQAARPRQVDTRFAAALAWVAGHLERPIRLAEVAQAAGVSESWLSHRFHQEKGVPLRRYVLWCRLRLAVEVALKGASLTQAAHQAGFSDSAHFTRTFRRAYGIRPSFLFAGSDALQVRFVDAGQFLPPDDSNNPV